MVANKTSLRLLKTLEKIFVLILLNSRCFLVLSFTYYHKSTKSGRPSSITKNYEHVVQVIRKRRHGNHRRYYIDNERISLNVVSTSGPTKDTPSMSQSHQPPPPRVIFQKIVRPTNAAIGNSSHGISLGLLIEYLQDYYQLPSDLPMVYTSMPLPSSSSSTSFDSDVDENEDDFINNAFIDDHYDNDSNDSRNNDDIKNRAILVWDSPLSSSEDETRMYLEVVSICTDDDEESDGDSMPSPSPSAPTMAMVVVSKQERDSKRQRSGTGNSLIVKNLFGDSEKRILRSLDKGLDDFCNGKIKFKSSTSSSNNMEVEAKAAVEASSSNIVSNNAKNDEEAIEAEIVMDNEHIHSFTNEDRKKNYINAEDVMIIDTTTASDSSPLTSQGIDELPSPLSNKTAASNHKKGIKNTEKKIVNKETLKVNGDGDYAVQAARQAANALKKQQRVDTGNKGSGTVRRGGGNDSEVKELFAVQAAKEAAEKALKNGMSTPTSAVSKKRKSAAGAKVRSQKMPQRQSFTPAFTATISTPEMRVARRKEERRRKRQEEKEKLKRVEASSTMKSKNMLSNDSRSKASEQKVLKASKKQTTSQVICEEDGSGDDDSIQDFAVKAAKKAARALEAAEKENAGNNETKRVSSRTQSNFNVQNKSRSNQDLLSMLDIAERADTKQANPYKITPVEETEVPDPLTMEKGHSKSKDAIDVDDRSDDDGVEVIMTAKRPRLKTNRRINMRISDDDDLDSGEDGEDEGLFEKLVYNKSNNKLKNEEEQNRTPAMKNKSNSSKQKNGVEDGEAKSKKKRTLTRSQIERDVIEAAQKVMSDIAETQGGDVTAEDMLQDVLKYDEAQKKEDAVGSGFVTGAFEKAKELLREQRASIEEKRRQRQQFKDVSTKPSNFGIDSDISDPNEKEENAEQEGLSAEEELKQIFEAGQRLADSRITLATGSDTDTGGALSGMAGMTEQEETEIDALVASEKTVSRNARQLDDELAELELRINKSPEEELDGPGKNPMFDIMSGPEVYNPNVDPETAVNWPGAQPGTKDVRLPKELDEAVKQAKFAVDVLMKMTKVEKQNDDGTSAVRFFVGQKELSQKQVDSLRSVTAEASRLGLIDNPLLYLQEQSRLQIVLDELKGQPEERRQEIASNYKDLLLSDNFIDLIKERLTNMAVRDLDAMKRGDNSLETSHAMEREHLGFLVNYAQTLLKQARALGAELEAAQLEVIRSICEVAMDPAHKTEEETSMALTDAVRDMRPMLDDMFVAYIKYAVAEEEGRLARAGLLDDPNHNRWLFVLKIVQQGVYAEIAKGIQRYLDHIWYVLRMETPAERRGLLKKFIDVMPTLDVRPFVQVVDNIVASLGDSVRGDFSHSTVLGEMTNKLLQLHRDTHELLPPERIKAMSADADEWAARQKKRFLEQRKVTKQRLKAARETEGVEDELEKGGEVETFRM